MRRFWTFWIVCGSLLLCLFPCACSGASRLNAVRDRLVGRAQGVAIHQWTYPSGRLMVKGLLFVPPHRVPLPAVIFCHDGISGISRQHKLSCIRLARAGYVVFAPSYRGEDGSQGTVEIAKGEVDDVLAAIPLVAALKSVDGSRIALAGCSHGALICLLAASRTDRIRAVVEAYGVANIYRWWDYLKRTGKLGHDIITRRTYGNGPAARPRSFAIRNAVSHVKTIDCPVLILQGGKDAIVPPEQARLLKKALDRYHKKSKLCIYPYARHGFLVYVPYLKHDDPRERKETAEAWHTMLAFLKRNLAPRAPLPTPALPQEKPHKH